MESTAVTTCKDKNGAFATPPLVDAVEYSFADDIVGPVHGPTVIRWAPATAIERYVLESEIQGRCLVDIRYWTRQDTDTSDFGIVRDSNTTGIIFNRGNLAGTTSAMTVII